MISDLIPFSSLADRWEVTPNTVSRRLAYLSIKPVRHGNFRFLTRDQLKMADSLHRHLKEGWPMSSFVAPSLNNVPASPSIASPVYSSGLNKRISKGLRWSILERDGHKCRACGATNCLEIDHIIPRSKGGPTIESNLQVLCADCNKGKGASIPKNVLDGVPLKELELRWSVSRNTVKDRAEILGVELQRISSTLTIWPKEQIEVGDQLHLHIQANKTSHGFYARKNTSQFNVKVETDLLEKFKAQAHAQGVMLGLDKAKSVNKAVHQAMQWYIESCQDNGLLRPSA